MDVINWTLFQFLFSYTCVFNFVKEGVPWLVAGWPGTWCVMAPEMYVVIG